MYRIKPNVIFDFYGTLVDIHTDEEKMSLWNAMKDYYRAYGADYTAEKLKNSYHAAVERAYDNIIPQGEHPNYFIYLHVDPQNIDVNVHPTKTEIKFENEQIIWQVINAVVREAIGKFNKVPVIDFDRKDDDINIPAMPNDGSVVRMQANRNTTFNPFNSGKREESQRPLYDWQKLYPQEKGQMHSPNLSGGCTARCG